jgi:hypothetical protein
MLLLRCCDPARTEDGTEGAATHAREPARHTLKGSVSVTNLPACLWCSEAKAFEAVYVGKAFVQVH